MSVQLQYNETVNVTSIVVKSGTKWTDSQPYLGQLFGLVIINCGSVIDLLLQNGHTVAKHMSDCSES